ncbi:N-acetyltransferase [Hymenobacter sp. BT664]|uniref:N-acetyltransferase n=1 Tax=Hymenobacter montanus TaxID=2771359 RepID=A0A927GHV7_9BACT|nr:N-acetyltransferase [Hymenobacter montanus]MBD2766421.1 N-acetyltransferase [Hymenobacter montanus]
MKFNNRNVHLGMNVRLGNNVRIGDNTTIYDNVAIGDNTIIANDCVIGEPSWEYYRHGENYTQPETVIGASALIRSHTILYAGSSFGENFTTGHRVTIRENCRFGRDCQVGTLTNIQGDVTFGDYCKMHSNVLIAEFSTIGNHVFIYPFTVFTNDTHPPSNHYKGPTIGDYSVITVHCIILPAVKIGTHCLVGANSVVNKDLPDFSFAVGSPAKIMRDVRELGGGGLYPWVYNFERGMPWQGIGFDVWSQQQ